jgi:hypothetical protein
MTLIAMHNIDVGSKPALHHPGFQKMHSGTLRRPETSQAYLTRLSVIPNPQSPIPPPNSFVLHFRALYSIKLIIDSFCRAHRMFFASTTSSQLSCLLACWSFLYPVTSVKQQLNQQRNSPTLSVIEPADHPVLPSLACCLLLALVDHLLLLSFNQSSCLNHP